MGFLKTELFKGGESILFVGTRLSCMEVQELIEELEQYDGDKEVKYNYGGVLESVGDVENVDRERLDKEFIKIR